MKKIIILGLLFILAVTVNINAQIPEEIVVWQKGIVVIDGNDSTHHTAVYLNRTVLSLDSLWIFLKADSAKGHFIAGDSIRRKINVTITEKYMISGVGSDTIALHYPRVIEDSMLVDRGMYLYTIPYTRPVDSLLIDFVGTTGRLDTSTVPDSKKTEISGFIRGTIAR